MPLNFLFPIAYVFSKKICHRDHEPRTAKAGRERERERGRGGRKLIVSFLWLEYESRIRVENVGEGRWRREQERENREYIGPGLDRLHPCHLPERGYVFSTCSIETESWIQRIGTIPEDTLVVRASADFVPFTFLCLLWSKYTPCKLVWRKIDI